MKNMFSGNTRKAIPRSFNDCTKPDNVSTNLWAWCELLESWGKVFFWIIIIFGVFATINAAIETQNLIDIIGADNVAQIREFYIEMGVEIPSMTEAIINSLLQWALYAFLEHCAYHVLALLIGALATITQNTAITANVALYNAHTHVRAEKASAETTSPKKENNETCTVQNGIPEAPAPQKEASQNISSPSSFDHKESWVCDKCGKENDGFYLRCQGCGKFR